jgi:SPP1 family predicted phage head-tail adaptor
MRAGALRHRVSIQSESSTLDSYGEPTSGWSTDTTVSASIDSVSGAERDIGEGLAGIVTHRIVMRYNTSVSPKKRLLFGSRVFGIVSVLNFEERNEFFTILCKEEVN